MDKKKSLTDQYISFMGSWFAMDIVGKILSKIIVFIFSIWAINKYVCN